MFLAVPCGMWDFSSPTRDGTRPLHWKLRILTTELPEKSLCIFH